MIKIIKYLSLSLLISNLLALSAYAQVKVDAGKIVQKGMEFAQEIQTKVEDIQKEIAKKMESLTKVGGNLEHNKLVSNIKSTAEKAKAKAASLQEKAAKAQQKVANAQQKASEEASKAMASGNDFMLKQQEFAALQTKQLTELQQMQDQMQEAKDNCQAKEKTYRDNIAMYEKQQALYGDEDPEIQAKIDELKQKMEQESASCIQKIQALEKDAAEKKKLYEDKINEMKNQISQIASVDNIGAAATEQLGNLFGSSSGGSNGEGLNQVIAKNFYAAGEERTPQRDGEIDAYRRQVEMDDSADVYYQSVQIMAGGDESIDMAYDLKNNAQGAETETAAAMLGISTNIEQMRSLHKFARLLIAELKQSTARDMVKMDRTLNNYEKDMTTIDLDSYKKAGKKKKSKKK